VNISRGVLDNDPIIWEFHISGKILSIEAEKLEMPSTFRTQYLRAFNHPAPRVKNEEWQNIIELLAEDRDKTTVNVNDEESEQVYIARELYAIVCGMSRDGDKDDLLLGNALYFESGLYWLKSTRVSEIVRDLGFKFVPNSLSTAATKLGIKEKGTRSIRHKGAEARAWGFVLSVNSDCECVDTENVA